MRSIYAAILMIVSGPVKPDYAGVVIMQRTNTRQYMPKSPSGPAGQAALSCAAQAPDWRDDGTMSWGGEAGVIVKKTGRHRFF
jgi:hypothetical protein